MTSVKLGGKDKNKFSKDLFSDELVANLYCPRCNEYLGKYYTGQEATLKNYIFYYYHYYRGNLEVPFVESFIHSCTFV